MRNKNKIEKNLESVKKIFSNTKILCCNDVTGAKFQLNNDLILNINFSYSLRKNEGKKEIFNSNKFSEVLTELKKIKNKS
ncbi:hypothetical protein [Tenacibaculum finnmarkense]|uniref:hypothetical protein n=1 Tax=Tenacibaculum finnmarkense TaxID=2781243 RepID=UPI001EFA30BD|nr:hypothetical protein [Tenacibaculum finnmarkense]MCG8226402.1 hypothetical protein [Tenacibaculum finnmarkense genomovar finnmarkense]